MRFVLAGKAKDVFEELAFIYLLQCRTGEVLVKCPVSIAPNSQN